MMFFAYTYVYMYVQQSPLRPEEGVRYLELELQAVMSCPSWGLISRGGSSGRAANTLSVWKQGLTYFSLTVAQWHAIRGCESALLKELCKALNTNNGDDFSHSTHFNKCQSLNPTAVKMVFNSVCNQNHVAIIISLFSEIGSRFVVLADLELTIMPGIHRDLQPLPLGC